MLSKEELKIENATWSTKSGGKRTERGISTARAGRKSANILNFPKSLKRILD
jgi:hypothetical protein